ncbi:hypothetical protein HDU99_004015 [Rhizoclosmatium hyalinum]|nr:hypothetical protein HDU99_004015 [Rhizoclosmatium hyalinum]
MSASNPDASNPDAIEPVPTLQGTKRKRHPTDEEVLKMQEHDCHYHSSNELLQNLFSSNTSFLPPNLRSKPLSDQVAYLYTEGADITTSNALFYATANPDSHQEFRYILTLPDLKINHVDEYGNTALHIASTLDRLVLLLKHGADPTIKNKYKTTPAQIHAKRFTRETTMHAKDSSWKGSLTETMHALEEKIFKVLLVTRGKTKAARSKQEGVIRGIESEVAIVKTRIEAIKPNLASLTVNAVLLAARGLSAGEKRKELMAELNEYEEGRKKLPVFEEALEEMKRIHIVVE